MCLTGRLVRAAHPRSRGENGLPTANKLHVLGSSPLTRGKRGVGQRYSSHRRLIPAHAGKTPSPRLRRERPGAHPRSRGENYRRKPFFLADDGSSPLTRGKQVGKLFDARPRRLIPAHAGKTSLEEHGDKVHAAHPRSRGENRRREGGLTVSDGSSPLTRGKLPVGKTCAFCTRLIPAHAGKTLMGLSVVSRARAHPRSRGENRSGGMPRAAASGSSPLTRGKRSIREDERTMTGLIPAHAGKTCPHRSRRPIHRAHPRSRGENLQSSVRGFHRHGSSPLTRGKRRCLPAPVGYRGLIPAHAGKTRRNCRPPRTTRAHPRSRGENKLTPGSV